MTIRILNFPDGFTSPSAPFDLSGGYVSYDVETVSTVVDSDNNGFQKRPIVGASPVTLNNAPFGTDGWDDGIVITLIGTDATNTVTVPFSDTNYGAFINGPITLGDGHSITLQWHQASLRWYELARNK